MPSTDQTFHDFLIFDGNGTPWTVHAHNMLAAVYNDSNK